MKRRIAQIIIALLTVLLAYETFFMMTRTFRKGVVDVSTVSLNGPADVWIGDSHYENISLDELKFDPVPAGTVMRYTLTMPEDELDSPMFTIYITHCITNVYLDQDLIYSYGSENKYMIGYGHVSFPLDNGYAGKELCVEYIATEKGETASLEPPVITENSAVFYRNQLCRLRLQYFIDFTLIMLGLSIAAVSLVFMLRDEEMVRLVYLAVSIFSMGLWVMCNYDLIGIFTNNLALKGYLEYLSFYIAPFFFTLYFADDFYIREKTFRRYIFLGILIAQGIFAVDCVVLHFTNIRHLPRSLPINHILLVLSLGFILYMSIRALIRKKHMHKHFLIGFFLLVVFCLRDMIYFFLYYYVGHNHGNRYESRMLSGVFIFAISMFLDFFSVQTRRKTAEARNELLDKMAYTDTMTGLFNRRKSDEEFASLKASHKTTSYGMISFDLNDLKKANDNYGHEAGDQLLTDFSNLLSEVFTDDCITCRMGGDEFLVIIPDEAKADAASLLDTLQKKCDRINETRTPLALSYAHGYCSSNDPEITAKNDRDDYDPVTEVFKCSDKRMYDRKIEMKAQRI
ncbi:MAG: diguanylate cyclase [Lachnospiraceae bacterium]|nr:diguanylate cyclase [Lachnospiraceae bacterium]